jgi:tetraacyldisaccharide 4'-kinase
VNNALKDCRSLNFSHIISILSGEDRSLTAALLRGGLRAIAPLYGLAVQGRNSLFEVGVRRSIRLPRPVISVGNLTTGGTGKTPMVIDFAQRIVRAGGRPAILLRGYKAKSGLSDEADVLRSHLGSQVIVAPNPDRVAAAKRVLESAPSITAFILDDGFQHRRVKRDLDLLLISAADPFGLGYLLPRGFLREPLKNARRADAVIVTNAQGAFRAALPEIDDWVRRTTGRPPIAHVAHAWTGFVDALGQRHELEQLLNQKVAAATGIGNPASFRGSLVELGAEIVEHRRFADHHVYTAEDLHQVFEGARQHNAMAVVTTEKDWVKWRVLLGAGRTPLPIFRPLLQMEFLDGSDALDVLLARVLKPLPEVAA